MKAFISIAIAAIIFSSCSTAYQSGQTPDDVYFSPQRPQASQNEYVNVEKNNSRRYQYNDDDEYNYDDAYLRMKVRNRNRWSALDNDFYFYNASPFASYNPYGYNPYASSYYGNMYYNNYGMYNPYGLYSGFGLGLGYSYNPYYNPYYSNPYYSHYGNVYYNPNGAPVIIVDKNNTRTPVYSRPRTSNLNIYNNRSNNNGSRRVYVERNNQRPSYNSNRNNSGSELRNVFGNSDRSSNNTPSRPSVNTPSSSNSSSSNSGSSGGSAPVRRF